MTAARPRRSFSINAGLTLLEDHERVGVNPIALHRLGCLVALHRFLERAEVRDLEEQPDPV